MFLLAQVSASAQETESQQPDSELHLTAPISVRATPVQSTLKMRVARRPWLLEKLTRSGPEPSIKMNPPRPPADTRRSDPPSISEQPIDPRQPMLDFGDWVSRGALSPAAIKASKPKARPQPEPKPEPEPKQTPAASANPTAEKKTTKSATPTLMPATDRGDQELKATEETEPSLAEAAETLPAKSDEKTTEAGTLTAPDQTAVPLKPAPLKPVPVKPAPTKAPGAIESLEPAKSLETTESAEPAEPLESSPSLKTAKPLEATEEATTATSKPAAADEKKESVPQRITVRALKSDPLKAPLESETNDATAAKTGPQPKAASGKSEESGSQYVGTEPKPRTDYAGYPMKPMSYTSSVRSMQRSMRSCLQHYFNRPEIANERSNWGMLHQIMVFGVDTRVIVGRKSYSAIAWIAGNNACRGQRLLSDGAQGIEARSGVGLQGHQSQMLAVFALCGVPADYPLYADKEKYNVADVVRAEMATCRRGAELTFTLIALSHYLDTDASWLADDGQRWDFERLIREELSQPIAGAACGGTHRLMGFSHALRKRRAAGLPITGQWKRAELFLEDFERYCYRLQNRDGSMSTDWFEGREDNGDLDRKIQTTGHMVEWLLTITPDSQLQNGRLVSAVRFLLNSMQNERDHEWKIGPKGHALRSLAMYYERVYRSGPAWRTQRTQRTAQSGTQTRR